jgi:S1-C subfamily serine protease
MNRFVMLVAGAAMSMFAMGASASDMAATANATFKLYDGNSGICSTTFMKNDKEGAIFLTAAHCVDGSDNLNVRVQRLDEKDLTTVLSERVYYVKAVKTLVKKDIALLQVRDKEVAFGVQPVDIATVEEAKALRIGDPLMAVGYPAAEALAITKGEYTGIVPSVFPSLDTPMYQTTVPVAGGNSGGALYANFKGEWKLIGTTTGKRTDNDIMTWFQTAETVNEVLKGYVTTGSKDAPAVDAVAPGNGIDNR